MITTPVCAAGHTPDLVFRAQLVDVDTGMAKVISAHFTASSIGVI